MTNLTITTKEHDSLRTKFLAMQEAAQAFTIAFTAAMHARDIADATFVSLSPDTLTVQLPELQLVDDAA